jgi:hypothetical protein
MYSSEDDDDPNVINAMIFENLNLLNFATIFPSIFPPPPRQVDASLRQQNTLETSAVMHLDVAPPPHGRFTLLQITIEHVSRSRQQDMSRLVLLVITVYRHWLIRISNK